MGSAQGVCGPGIGSEHASLVNCLIGAAILQLRRAVSRDGNQRNTGLAGFDDGRQPVGWRGAGSGQKQYRVPLHLGHSEGEESSAAFVDRDLAAQPGLAQHGQRQGGRARTRRNDRIGNTSRDKTGDQGLRPVKVE